VRPARPTTHPRPPATSAPHARARADAISVLRSGEAAEAAMEEEIAEFEEEGGLALSIVIWLFALAAPCAVLLVRP